MIFGCTNSTCRRRKGSHCAISSGSGLRLPGGRHFSTLAMKTLSRRFRPSARSMLSRSLPAWPTKGSPCRSSFSPGASPITSQSACCGPTPKTVLCRPSHSLQARQVATASRNASQSMPATPPMRSRGAAAPRTGMETGAAGAGTRARMAGSASTAASTRAGGCSGASSLPARVGQNSSMPISLSIARWRSSRTRLMGRSSLRS